ncbi:MAG: hypothetical protein H6861_08025 [Rhodospirillales bacterium]|nr:hypothetical protein [Rhodospirillales bacterium]
MMRVFLFFVLTVLAVSGAVSVQAADDSPVQFFEALGDVPLMPGLVERTDGAVSFDKPGGRIVESVADLNAVPVDDVAAYYASALPQFGWLPTAQDTYIRQGERLELLFETDSGGPVLRISIHPQ